MKRIKTNARTKDVRKNVPKPEINILNNLNDQHSKVAANFMRIRCSGYF
jgi:hypothetical protein